MNVITPKVAHHIAAATPMHQTKPLGKAKGGDGRVQVAEAKSKHKYAGIAANDKKFEDFAIALTGKTAQERTPDENRALAQLRKEMADGIIDPIFVEANPANGAGDDKLPPGARGAFVRGEKGAQGRVLISGMLRGQQLQKTSDEEQGEAVSDRARQLGIGVADGDAGARVGSMANGKQVTRQSDAALFRDQKSDTITVIANGKPAVAEADAGKSSGADASKASMLPPAVKTPASPPSPSSALDTLKSLVKDDDPATKAFLRDLTGAKSEDEMMKIINANPKAFLKAVHIWAKANGKTAESTDILIYSFLGGLRTDMGFVRSLSQVPDNHLILLVGGDSRINATVSTIGQMIYEKHGEAAWKDYKAKIEADWGADGTLSDNTLAMLDDVLSTAKANYKPRYDVSGALFVPSPDVRIAQLYIELGKKYGGIEPDVTYNDLEAQIHFQTGKELGTRANASMPTPAGNLLKSVQSWLAINNAQKENKRKYDKAEITKEQYVETDSFLSAQLKEARGAVKKAAVAAGVDPDLMLRKGVAEGFVIALTDPTTAAEVEALGGARTFRARIHHQIEGLLGAGKNLDHPETKKLVLKLKETDAQIAKLETSLKSKGVDVTDDPKAAAGGGFGGLNGGVVIARDAGLDKAHSAEKMAVRNGKPPSYTELFAKIDLLAATRAELSKVDADEAAGIIAPWIAKNKRAELPAKITAMEAELTALAKANGLPADTFTNPGKAKGYVAAAKNDDLAPLFVAWRQKKAELARQEAELRRRLAADPSGAGLDTESAKVMMLREDLDKIEGAIFDKFNVADPVAAAKLEKKRAERNRALAVFRGMREDGPDREAWYAAHLDYIKLNRELEALEAKPLPGNIEAIADGAIAADKSGADTGWQIETDPAYRVGYQAVDVLSKDQMAAVLKFGKSLDVALADGKITAEERLGLVAQYREVAAFLPPKFLGDVNAATPAQDPSWDAILTKSRAILGGSFADGATKRSTEIQSENEQMVLAADPKVLLAKLAELSKGKLKGESATAHTQYVLQMLGVSVTPKELDAFLKGGALPAGKQKAMLLAAQFFAQSRGQKVDDAAALKTLRNALSGDMGRSMSIHKVRKWEEFTFAGTDNPEANPDGGPATPQTELLRSMLSVLHEIYAEVYGEDKAAELDKKVEPRFFDGAIVPVTKSTARAGYPNATEFDYYKLGAEHWDPETGKITGLKDNPSAMVEWKFEVVLTKSVPGRGGSFTAVTERVDPSNQEQIAKLKAEGYSIVRVEAKPASEPQRMMGRLLEGLATYMKTYKPVYDGNGKLTNAPPLARIAQYYVQTQFAADKSDSGRFKNYRIEQTGIIMTDAEAIKFMFKELGVPEGDIDALLGSGGQQLSASSALYDPDSKFDKIFTTVVDSVFTFGLMGLLSGLIDKLTTDPLTDFGNDQLGARGRDKWRSDNRDKMDDPSVFSLVFDTLMFAVPEVFGGFVFTAGATAGRLAKTGGNVADTAVDTSRAGPSTIWDNPDTGGKSVRDQVSTGTGKDGKARDLSLSDTLDYLMGGTFTDRLFNGNAPDFTLRVPDQTYQFYMVRTGSSEETQRLLSAHGLAGSSDVEMATFVPGSGRGDVVPPMADGTPGPTTPNIYKWEDAVTFESPPGKRLAETTTPGIYTGPDAMGKATNYARVVGPDGRPTYVRVDGIQTRAAEAAIPAIPGRAAVAGRPAVDAVPADPTANPPVIGSAAVPAVDPVRAVPAQPAVLAKPAEYEWHIYNPTEGASSVRTMPKIEYVAGTNSWKMKDTTAVRPGDYNILIDSGTYVSSGRAAGVGLLPGLATNSLVRSIRGGDGAVGMPITDPMAFSTTDPLTLLTANGRTFLDKNPVIKENFLNDFKKLQDRNEKLQIGLQTVKEDKAFWDSALIQLENLREIHPNMTWANLKVINRGLYDALETANLTRRTSEQLLPETSINTLIAGVRREGTAAQAEILKAEEAIIGNTRTLDGVLADVRAAGDGNKARSKRILLRNGAIGLAFIGIGGGTFVGVNVGVKKATDPAKDPFDKKENIELGQDAEQTVNVAELTGTKGKGYTYELTSDFLNNNGVTIDKKTGKVIVSSKAGSSLVPGDEETFSVLVKDAKGNTMGKLTITVKVDDGKTNKPVVLATGKLAVTPDTPVTFNVAAQSTLPASKDYVYILDSANPVSKGLLVDAKTGLLTADAKDGSDLKPGTSYDIAVLVKNAAGVTVGRVTVKVTVDAKK